MQITCPQPRWQLMVTTPEHKPQKLPTEQILWSTDFVAQVIKYSWANQTANSFPRSGLNCKRNITHYYILHSTSLFRTPGGVVMYMINLPPLVSLQVHCYPEFLEEVRPWYKSTSTAAKRPPMGVVPLFYYLHCANHQCQSNEVYNHVKKTEYQ